MSYEKFFLVEKISDLTGGRKGTSVKNLRLWTRKWLELSEIATFMSDRHKNKTTSRFCIFIDHYDLKNGEIWETP